MGKWKGYGDCVTDDWAECSFSKDIRTAVNQGNAVFSGDYTDQFNQKLWYPVGGGSYAPYEVPYLSIYAAGLERDGLTLDEEAGTVLDVAASFNLSSHTLQVTVKGWKNTREGELDLPGDLTEIQARAFENTDAANVLIPDGCLSIGDYAFANSSVQSVTIPNPRTVLGAGVFDNCSPLMIIAPDGSPAAEYAQSHDILRLRP